MSLFKALLETINREWASQEVDGFGEVIVF